MPNSFSFTAFVHPEPQGSAKAFIINGHAHVTSANKNLKPFRSVVTREAMTALEQMSHRSPFADKHVPVAVHIDVYLEKPASVPKKRTHPAVKPDLDKLVRSCLDSLTGVAYKDDAQVCEVLTRKHYGSPERVVITVTILAEPQVSPSISRVQGTIFELSAF